jgi:hypothetical protein
MNVALIQLWESFESGNHQSDGCSLHIDKLNRNGFIESYEETENPVGLPSEVSVSDAIFDILENEKNIRLSEIEMNNLIGLNDIKIL